LTKSRLELQKLLKKVHDLSVKSGLPVLIAVSDGVTTDSKEINMVSNLPQGAPPRMAAARSLLMMGHTVFNDSTIIGDREKVTIKEGKS